ncbi:MAG: DUF4097 family beta strand repeat protein, partial [Flavobacteriaceae bacterium]|nr:DUF4097 family beta strand repeat protein [Flavobacteriaceae bacterium]
MKTIKTIPFLALFIIGITFANAQDVYTHSLDGIKQVKILTGGDIHLIAGKDKQLLLEEFKGKNHLKKIVVKINQRYFQKSSKEREDKAKGLRAIYAGGEDNTGNRGFNITKEGDVLIVKDLKSGQSRDNFTIALPKTIDVFIDAGNLGSIYVSGFSSELELKTHTGDIELIEVTGPLTVFTNTGDIDVTFSAVNQQSPISIRANTGDVDVSLPSNTKTDLVLKSNMGTVYTDFDFKIESKDGMK